MQNSTRRSSIPVLVISLGVLFILGAVYLILLTQGNQANQPGDVTTQGEQLQVVPRVSLEEAKAAFDAQEAVFLDVRDSAAYVENHIPGSVSIPLTDLEARSDELDPNDWIITYCT